MRQTLEITHNAPKYDSDDKMKQATWFKSRKYLKLTRSGQQAVQCAVIATQAEGSTADQILHCTIAVTNNSNNNIIYTKLKHNASALKDQN